MHTINFQASPDDLRHECTSQRHGDWIIFRCPHCDDYERRLNWRTGEMRVRNARTEINHTGRYFPREYKEAFENVN